jgi:hypothetical protein
VYKKKKERELNIEPEPLPLKFKVLILYMLCDFFVFLISFFLDKFDLRPIFLALRSNNVSRYLGIFD